MNKEIHVCDGMPEARQYEGSDWQKDSHHCGTSKGSDINSCPAKCNKGADKNGEYKHLIHRTPCFACNGIFYKNRNLCRLIRIRISA